LVPASLVSVFQPTPKPFLNARTLPSPIFNFSGWRPRLLNSPALANHEPEALRMKRPWWFLSDHENGEPRAGVKPARLTSAGSLVSKRFCARQRTV
jgi:hypothetical protein